MPETASPIVKLLLTPPEAAEALSISARTLWTMTRERQVPCLRIGRLVRYDPEALRRWIAGKQAPAASSGANTEETTG